MGLRLDEELNLQLPARIVDTAWFDYLVDEARRRLRQFCCTINPVNLAPLRGLRCRNADGELLFSAHFRDRRDWNWICATPRGFDQRLYECSGFERICMELVECYIDQFHAREPRWHRFDELIAQARWRIEHDNDVIRPGVVFRGVDLGREDSYTTRTVRLGEFHGFEFIEQRAMQDLATFGMGRFVMSHPEGYAKAAARGEQLLREWLSPAQLKQYDESGAFEVVGGQTGTRYRITRAASFNVLTLNAKGKVVNSLCFAPKGNLVLGDVMLAQKVALETDEHAALKVANRDQLGPSRQISGYWEFPGPG